MKKYLILFIAILISHLAAGQEEAQNTFKLPAINATTVFDTTLKRLMQSPYFVVSADKGSGFIQCKSMLKDGRWLSGNIGNIIHYNLLIQADADKSTIVYIQANNIEKTRSGGTNTRDYYDDDLGISTDKRYIDPLIEFVKNGFRETDD